MKTLYAIAIAAVAMMAMAETIYLDKMDKVLDDWWNALDVVCRGESGEESDLACDQRLQVDKIIEKRGMLEHLSSHRPSRYVLLEMQEGKMTTQKIIAATFLLAGHSIKGHPVPKAGVEVSLCQLH